MSDTTSLRFVLIAPNAHHPKQELVCVRCGKIGDPRDWDFYADMGGSAYRDIYCARCVDYLEENR